jgi:hypothetical protein
MKILLVIFLLFFGSFQLHAQKFRTIELKPIIKQGGTYFYNLKRVHGGAYGLQIPLQSLEDEEINKRYKAFRSWRVAESVFAFVPLIYILSHPRGRAINRDEFWLVYGVSIGGIIGGEIIAKHHLQKGIERYNSLVIGASSQSVGLVLSYRF